MPGYTGGSGGGSSNHADLSNLAWPDSGHTGDAETFTAIDSGGNPVNLAYSDVRSVLSVPKYWTKTTAPTVNDDSADGYVVGDVWNDTTGNNTYIADSVSVGAADWRALESQTNKNVAGGYMAIQSNSSAKVAQRTIHFAKTKVAWTTGVAVTINTEITANSDYMLNINFWLERVTSGPNRRSSTWRHLLRRTGGTLSILHNGEVGSLGGFAPTQAWAVSGDNLSWTITSAASDGYITYFRELLDCSDMTVA